MPLAEMSPTDPSKISDSPRRSDEESCREGPFVAAGGAVCCCCACPPEKAAGNVSADRPAAAAAVPAMAADVGVRPAAEAAPEAGAVVRTAEAAFSFPVAFAPTPTPSAAPAHAGKGCSGEAATGVEPPLSPSASEGVAECGLDSVAVVKEASGTGPPVRRRVVAIASVVGHSIAACW